MKRIITPGVAAADMIITNIEGCERIDSTLIKKVEKKPGEGVVVKLNDKCYNEAYALAAPEVGDAHTFRDTSGAFINFKRLRASHCDFCDREHTRDSAYAGIFEDGTVIIGCSRGTGKCRVVGTIKVDAPATAEVTEARPPPAKSLQPIMPNACPPKTWNITTYCSEHVEDFGQLPRTLVVKSLMGTGKSYALRQSINRVKAESPDMKIIIVSFRRSFTSEVVARLEGFVDYRKCDKIINEKYLVVQYESMHRVLLSVGGRCLLVLDESESILNQIAHGDNRAENWEKFGWFMQYSTHVISMDAFPTERTFSMIERMRPGPVEMRINTFKPANGPTDIYYAVDTAWIGRLNKCLTNAREEPVVVVSSSFKQSQIVLQMARDRCPHARIKIYTRDSSNEDRRDFDDVNTAWADVDVLIYTSTVSAGCSFELDRFTRVFAWFTNVAVDYNTAVQMLGRVRSVSTREYHIHCKFSNTKTLWLTEPELERSMAQKQWLMKTETNPTGLPRLITADGQYEYPYKDSFYYANLRNLMHKMKSQRWFERLLRGLRASMGANVRENEVKPTAEQMEAVKARQKIIVGVISAAEYGAVAAAPMMTFEELDEAEIRGHETTAERLSMIKTRLCRDYNVGEERITAEFVGKYDKPAARRIYRTLNTLEGMAADSFSGAVKEWRKCRDRKTTSIEELEDGKNIVRVMAAVDLLNIVMPEVGEVNGVLQVDKPFGFANNNRRVCRRAVARTILEAYIDKAVAHIQAHADVACLVFDLRKTRLMQKRTDLKSKIAFVNGLIKAAIGATIKAPKVRTGTQNDLFYLTEPALFLFDQKSERYVPSMYVSEQKT